MRHILTTSMLALLLAAPSAAFAFAGDLGNVDLETVPDVKKAYKQHAAKQAAKKKAAEQKAAKATKKKEAAKKAGQKAQTES